MELITQVFTVLDNLTWGWSLIPILVIFGVFMTIVTGFVQIRYFGRMFRVLVGRDPNADPNIAGVAVAITLGGPGAVFWMWAIALVGMCTSLVECTLAQVYKTTAPDGTFRGRPAAYIRRGLGRQYGWLAVLYAVCLIGSFAFGFNAFQGNTIAGAFNDSLGIERLWTGLFLAVVTGFIIYGGIKRIAKVADVIVPLMALTYIAVALAIIVMNIGELPRVIGMILANAFGIEEAVSGGMGAAIAQGLRRGLFSNEAGLGSAPNVAATAAVHHPISQGITQSLSVFIDTILICSATAFMILLGKVYVPGAEGVDGIALTQQSLVSHLGTWAQYYLTFAVFLFAFSSIIYNYYLGETALAELTKNALSVHALRFAVILIVLLGASAPGATSVFFFSDPLMGLLALVNLMAVLMLFPVALRVLNDYRDQLNAGIERPVFDAAKFPDLDVDRDVWKPGSR
jgi:AGCS family alanine or glycine:cation symporter